MKLITSATVSERLKINGSLARAGIQELLELGKIRTVHYHHAQGIYTRQKVGKNGLFRSFFLKE